MQKRLFIVHGWDGHPNEGWFPWLKAKLESKGWQVVVPQLPDAAHPRIETWVPALAKAVGTANSQTYFVGHSMGCQTILRYIDSLPAGSKVGGAVFVAGFLKRLVGLEVYAQIRKTAQLWLETPLDLGVVRSRIPKSIAIFSDDDPFVLLDESAGFRDKLDSEIIVEHDKGHLNGPTDGVMELPSVLEAVQKLAGV